MSELKLACLDFWIHVLDVSFGRAKVEVGEALGRSLGMVKGVLLKGNSLLLPVAWDILKPLCRGICIMKNGALVFLAMKYEKVPDSCYKYGMFTHFENECLAVMTA